MLKREEEEKITAMKDKMMETAAEMVSLRETICVLEQEMEADDMILLQVCFDTPAYVNDFH